MTNKERAYQYIEMLVNTKDDGKKEMGFLLLFYGHVPYKIESFPGAGHDYYSILDAMYEYKNNNPLINIDEIFKHTIDLMIETMIDEYSLKRCYNYLIANLSKEKAGKSNIKINIKYYLIKIKNQLKKENLTSKDILDIDKAATNYIEKNFKIEDGFLS
ncbi:MAG: hypothetical protein E7399_07815 [Ruminococcaceae bacterium]|nr:hypothetical protein [Oscillospiraceae bacterium]